MKKRIKFMVILILVLILSLEGCKFQNKHVTVTKIPQESGASEKSDTSEETKNSYSEIEWEDVTHVWKKIKFKVPVLNYNLKKESYMYSADDYRYFVAHTDMQEDYEGKTSKDVVVEFFPYIIKTHKYDIAPNTNTKLVAELEETVTINENQYYHFVGKIVGDEVTSDGTVRYKEQPIAFYTIVKGNIGFAFYGIEGYINPKDDFEEVKFILDTMVSSVCNIEE